MRPRCRARGNMYIWDPELATTWRLMGLIAKAPRTGLITLLLVSLTGPV